MIILCDECDTALYDKSIDSSKLNEFTIGVTEHLGDDHECEAIENPEFRGECHCMGHFRK